MADSTSDPVPDQTTAEAIVSGVVIFVGLGLTWLFSAGKYAILEARSKVWDRSTMESRK